MHHVLYSSKKNIKTSTTTYFLHNVSKVSRYAVTSRYKKTVSMNGLLAVNLFMHTDQRVIGQI